MAEHADKNLMQASNLGVVLGPTLMRPREETMAAIMGIKFQSIVIETMIKEFDEVLSVVFGLCLLCLFCLLIFDVIEVAIS